MPYYTDTVVSFTLLKSTIESYCVANGWTLADDILSKDSCFFKLVANSTVNLTLQSGTSKTGSTLNTKCPIDVKLQNHSDYPITFPIRFHLFIFNDPIEVYCFIEYDSGFFQQISFGKSNLLGVGLGAWFTGSYPSDATGSLRLTTLSTSLSFCGSAGTNYNGSSCGLFVDYYNKPCSFIYTSLGSAGWYYRSTSSAYINASACVSGLLTALPNTSNQSTLLLPIKSLMQRSSGGLTILNTLNNARLLRIDNHEAKDIVTFGFTQWMVFPWFRRDVTLRNGSLVAPYASDHSGTFGFAIRYEV